MLGQKMLVRKMLVRKMLGLEMLGLEMLGLEMLAHQKLFEFPFVLYLKMNLPLIEVLTYHLIRQCLQKNGSLVYHLGILNRKLMLFVRLETNIEHLDPLRMIP